MRKKLLILISIVILLGGVSFFLILRESARTSSPLTFEVTNASGITFPEDQDTAESPSSDQIQDTFLAGRDTQDSDDTEVPFDQDLRLAEIDSFKAAVEAARERQNNEDIDAQGEDDRDTQSEDIITENEFTWPRIVQRESGTAVIIDTDFASDADDVIAVRLAMCFQDKGMLDIRGIALSTSYSRSPLAVHALCKQDGYGNIPVAMDTSGNGVQVYTNYVDVMYDMPRDRNDYEQPVEMYRRILSESDTKVNIITLGFLQNIKALMDSSPDRYSPLSGMELIAEKVDTIYIVGGNSTGKPSFNFYWPGEKGIEAARAIAKEFPATVVYLQTDLSDDTFCGQFYNTIDSSQRDIVTKALRANKQEQGVVAWDVFSVWCAAQDMNGNLETFYLEKEQGTQYISNTGASQWTADSAGRHFRIVKRQKGEYYNTYLNHMLSEKYDNTHANSQK